MWKLTIKILENTRKILDKLNELIINIELLIESINNEN